MRAPMGLAFGSMRESRSACVRPLVARITPFCSRIQVSRETNVPTCGEYPGRGPKTLGLGSLACAVSGSASTPIRVEKPAVTAAELFRKLLRLEKHGVSGYRSARELCSVTAMAVASATDVSCVPTVLVD